ncbi:MAG TPA: hypothetical protein VG456_01365 [Candidatus Sulfopaludibacter sp.]|jgi:hypothetical protein|nr:hypothetical protein [Candidatus Sulfopaludibacter sp.]
MRTALQFTIAAVLVAGGLRLAGQKESPAHKAGAVEIQMRNVHMRMSPAVALQVRSLRGRLTPLGEGPVTLDAPDSFVVDVDSGVMSLSTDSLSQLLNSYVFAYPGAPLKKISISAKGNRLVQKGIVHKGVDLPFEMEGELTVTADGNLRMHVDTIKSAHLPVKGLLHFLGEDLSKLINVNEARGVRMEGDDILMFPSRMLPPPHIRGRIAEVHVEGNNVVQTFHTEHEAATLRLPVPAANYIYHRGGVLRFGKLTMTDADLEIVDQTPANPFDFSLAGYNRQLVAGYSKNTLSHGLVVHMPDFAQVGK